MQEEKKQTNDSQGEASVEPKNERFGLKALLKRLENPEREKSKQTKLVMKDVLSFHKGRAITVEELEALAEELETILSEIRTEVQNKHNND